jgi:hypothetical protein
MQTVIAAEKTPTPFFILGAAGLLPFVAGAAAMWALPHEYQPALRQWILGYAMVILAFVGALHWGVAMQTRQAATGRVWTAAVWSVLPALVAWLALALDGPTALRVLAGMFALDYAMDRWLARNFVVPPWYLRLRGSLTAVAVATLLIASFR